MHPKQEQLEADLERLCSALDNYLEDLYEGFFSLHPNRLRRGSGANPSFDGIFSTSISFTLGYGSVYGRGYIVAISVRTLAHVSAQQMEEINNRAFVFIGNNLSRYLPERQLEIVKDGKLLKIIGDFSLGDV